MRLLMDECVPDLVADALGDLGHEIHFARDECPEAPDHGVQHHADQIGAIVVTWNIKHFRQLPRSHRTDRSESHLGRIDFRCEEALGAGRVVELGNLIDTAYAMHQEVSTERFFVRITTQYITFFR